MGAGGQRHVRLHEEMAMSKKKPLAAQADLALRIAKSTQKQQSELLRILTLDPACPDNIFRRMLSVITDWFNEYQRALAESANDKEGYAALAEKAMDKIERLFDALVLVGERIPHNPRRHASRDAEIVRDYDVTGKIFSDIGKEKAMKPKAVERAYHREKKRQKKDAEQLKNAKH